MPRRIWRPLRSFLILICVGGAVLVADNAWLRDLRFDFNAADWWSNVSPAETPSADIALASEPANHRAPQLSMRELLNGLLFYPTSSWRIDSPDSPRSSSSLAWMMPADSSTAIATSPQSSSTPFVSLSISDSRSSAGASVPDGGPPPPPGYWISNASGNWSNPSNWQGGVIANGSTAQAHFDTLDITTNVTVTLDSSRIIGELDVGDTNGTHRYDIAPGSSGQRIIFDSNTTTSIL